MTDQELLLIMNGIVKVARPVSADELNIESLDTLIKDTGLDSLDFLMVGVYLSDIYGVSEEDVKLMKLTEESTIRDVFEFMFKHSTQTPKTVEEALENVK